MVADLSEATTPLESRLNSGEFSPANDQAMLPTATSTTTVADFDFEIEELAFYRQNEERVWYSLGTWDM